MAGSNGTNHEARTEIAVLTAQVEALTRETHGYHDEVREYRQENQARQKEHSRRLDEYGLAIAALHRGEKEREEIRKDVERLKAEQRWWTGATTLLAAVGSYLGLKR